LELILNVSEYMEIAILQVIECYCSFHPWLQVKERRVVHDLVVKRKNDCEKHVKEKMEMEKPMDSILSPSYIE
jgi:hypothetical protein